EKRKKFEGNGGDHSRGCRPPAPRHHKAGWDEEKTEGTAEGWECIEGRQHREFHDGRKEEGADAAAHDRDGGAVSREPHRRESKDQRCCEPNGRGAARPSRGDPERLDRT